MPARRVRERPPPAILIDTNVVLDLLLGREPWAAEAASLFDAVGRGAARGYVAAHAVTTVRYVVARSAGAAAARMAVADLLDLVAIVPLDAADLRRALALDSDDYEDAVQAAACLKVGAAYLVTRNARDFRRMPVTARPAIEVLALLNIARP